MTEKKSLKSDEVFRTYSLTPPRESVDLTLTGQTVVMYGINPGPSKSIIPLAESFANKGAKVVFKLGEPALSNILAYFSDRIEPSQNRSNATIAFTCGHINADKVTEDMMQLKKNNPGLNIITMDDNFDGTLPIIQKLATLNVAPAIAFIMNPLSKDPLEKFLAEVGADSRVIVTNNPAFERFYAPENNNQLIRNTFREEVDVAPYQKLLTYIGFPEGDYPLGYSDFVFTSVAQALEQINEEVAFIYWPHGRGADLLPEQFEKISNKHQVIFHERAWWDEHNIGIHKQLIGADVALMTNSTASAEVFTAWGKGKTPMSVPIDISLVEDFPDLQINRTLRGKNLVHYLPSRKALISSLPQIIVNPLAHAPLQAAERLVSLNWEQSPITQIIEEVKKLTEFANREPLNSAQSAR